MNNIPSIVIAVDLGGTKLRTALILNGDIVSVINKPTNAVKGPTYIIDLLRDTLVDILKRYEHVNAISIAVAGAIDVINGVVTSSPHLPGWCDVPLRNIVSGTTSIKTFVLNDVNAAALGEHTRGIAKHVKNFVYVAIGTGIGGGIVINDKLYEGVNGTAGEIGHMIIKENGPECSCGHRGCLEVLASGSAIEREMARRIKKIKNNTALKYRTKGGRISAKEVALAAKSGDNIAREVIDEAGYYLGIGIANIINIFNPEMIVLGGGISKIGNLFLKPAMEVALDNAFKLPASNVRLVKSRLGDNAGILGAAAFAESNFRTGISY